MNSILTRTRPDLWIRAQELAIATTGYEYSPKTNGRMFACYSYRYDPDPSPPKPVVPKTPEQIKREEQEREEQRREKALKDLDAEIADIERRIREGEDGLERLRDLLREKQEKRTDVWIDHISTMSVIVPEGSMEWLLHEVGHWVAATPEERALPNYGLSASETGLDGDREWQAWAFQEIVLMPHGPAREFAAPTVRDGAGFSKVGPIPAPALDHIDRQIRELKLDVEPWRMLYGDWVKWGRSLGPGRAPWEMEQ